MSATRDKSQNVGFVYTNIYQLYKKAQSAPAAAPVSSAAVATHEESLASNARNSQIFRESRVWRAEELGEIKITKFQPRTLSPSTPLVTPADIAPVARQAPGPIASNPFDDLKSNLQKLQDLHSKLRFMLAELDELVSKK